MRRNGRTVIAAAGTALLAVSAALAGGSAPAVAATRAATSAAAASPATAAGGAAGSARGAAAAQSATSGPATTSAGKVLVAYPNAVVNNAATPASVLAYLKGIEGASIISGQHNAEPNTEPAQYTNEVDAITGEYPGLWGGDFLYESDSIAARQTMINEAETQWADGSLVTLMWHECPPTIAEPCDWTQVESVDGALTTAQWQQLTTDGSALNTAWKNELGLIVPYLQQLKNAGIPVLWRPLHEINDSWSWWGGTPYTAALWQLTYNYLVNTEGLTNLIWVWSVKDSGSTSALSTYYPGNQYVDVLALDPWDSSFPTTAWYQAIQSMASADGKPMALAEVGTLPTPAQLSSQPDWTYFNDWASYITSNNTNAQIQATYYDSRVLHQGQISLPSGSGPPAATGPITGYDGLCLDDSSALTTDFNPIQVYTCNGTAAQQWTVESNSTLQVLGKCLDVKASGTADGTLVDLYDCNGTGAQVWQSQSNGSLLNPESGKCLDDTGWSTTPGTQAQIWDCSGNANQQWKLP
jgi:mannan endo-1,4-beta-mannosidase